MRSAFFFALTSLTLPALGRIYNIYNRCPSPINVYLSGKSLLNLTSNWESTVILSDDEAYFYTDANSKSGSSNGTRVGFKLEPPYGYSYMVVDPNNFNVGVSIAPEGTIPGEYCGGPICRSPNCTGVFNNNQEPTDSELNSLPISGNPLNPLHSCIYDDMVYYIIYCPDTTWPPASLNPDGNTGYCLDVQGAKFENGTPVQLYVRMQRNTHSTMGVNRSSTKVQLDGTNFCLDAGSTPGNGVGMKIWECLDDLPAQAWYYTDDNRLALEGQGLCLDLANGSNGNGSFVQTWQCTANDNNQVWT